MSFTRVRSSLRSVKRTAYPTPAKRHRELFGQPLGDGARGDPPRLGVPDHAADAAPEVQADLGQLSGLARTRLAGDDDHLMPVDRGAQLIDVRADRQRRRIGDRRHRRLASRHAGLRGENVLVQLLERLCAGHAASVLVALKALQARAEPRLVA